MRLILLYQSYNHFSIQRFSIKAMMTIIFSEPNSFGNSKFSNKEYSQFKID